MPRPFQRPSVHVAGAPAASLRREWREIPVTDVRAGDVVPGIGLVESVSEDVSENVSGRTWTVTLVGGDGNLMVLPGEHTVNAFTVVCL
jgi:hypothetical protein